MNDKQREATKIVLQQCSEGHLDAEEALTIIDSIVGEPPQVQYVPCPGTTPNPTRPIRKAGGREMTQIHFRKAGSGDYIKDWPNWTGVVPAFPDLVVLHYGDDNEEEKRYRVEGREISGTEPDDVTIYLSEYPSNQCNLTDEEIEDLRQEIRRESERLSAEHNPALDLTIEDCKDDMSIRSFNICRKNGIRTLRDLTLLHKTDWLKFRNSGKRSLECIDDLLTKHGLTWAKWE